MEQNVLPFMPENIFSNINVEQLNSFEKRSVIDLAKTILEKDYLPGKPFTKPEDAKAYLQLKYQDLEHEVFAVVYLTQKHRMITIDELFRGTLDGASVYPREVVKSVLQHNAAAVLFVHNHPSGDPEPSQADRNITARLVDALKMIDVRVNDHLVVGKEGVVSFAERGLI